MDMIVPIAHAILVRNNKVLLVQQRKSNAYGLWSFPGGHVEPGESPLEAVRREVLEEIGAPIANVELVATYRLVRSEGEMEFHTYTATLQGNIALKDDELLAYGWFSLEALETMEAMTSMLRQPITPHLVRLLTDLR